jgi:predicted transcriptional regulator
MIKERPTSIRLGPEEREALRRAAEADDRPVSALMRKIIVDWLTRNKWLVKSHEADE